MAKRETKRQSVTLTASQAEVLKREAEKFDISISDMIRRIVDEWRADKEARQ